MPSGKKILLMPLAIAGRIGATFHEVAPVRHQILVSSSNIYLFIRAADVERR
jgi:hypothetical protein